MMYKKLVEFEEDENKENLEAKLEEKKEEKKFRLNLKKGKTSLIVKKPVILWKKKVEIADSVVLIRKNKTI